MCGMHQGPADHGPAVLGLTPKGSSWDWGSPGLEAQSGERMVSIGWHDIFFRGPCYTMLPEWCWHWTHDRTRSRLWATDCPRLILGVWAANSGACVPMAVSFCSLSAIGTQMGSMPVSVQQCPEGGSTHLVRALLRPAQCQHSLLTMSSWALRLCLSCASWRMDIPCTNEMIPFILPTAPRLFPLLGLYVKEGNSVKGPHARHTMIMA